MDDISGGRALRSSSKVTSEDKPSAQKLSNVIRRAIQEATGPTYLTYDNVDAHSGLLIVESLDQSGAIENISPRLSYNSFTQTLTVNVMPTFTQNCHQKWLVKEFARMASSAFLSLAEYDRLDLSVGTTFKSFQTSYASSIKQPDLCFEVKGQQLPSIVLESGWTESMTHLHRDMRLWLIGGAGEVQLVLLPKWTKHAGGQVSGVIELWGLDQMGNETLMQTAIIYPAPAPEAAATNQVLQITRKQLFGSAVLPGRNPNDTFDLAVDTLREKAADAIHKDGLVPA